MPSPTPRDPYCLNCARPDGSMKSYEEVLDGMVAFLVRTQALDATAARVIATRMLSGQAAWRNR